MFAKCKLLALLPLFLLASSRLIFNGEQAGHQGYQRASS
jgi:hypothetical protein